ncbi:amidase signature domain-containing protein [Limtongia smithiae]|uniref:amidase signature domain-containing protein n=1 Tax=Limtongia smithiae TaxID=1125753 RepID=UPI0034CF5F32
MKPVVFPATHRPYAELVAEKLAERESRIPQEWRITFDESKPCLLDVPSTCGLLSAKELEITENYDSVGLLAELAAGKLSAVEVATAFNKRAAIAQQCLNCLTEIFFDKAIARANFLDEELKRTGKPVGPLHGLPVALKDSMNVEGEDSVVGIAAYIGQPEKENSVIVDILLQLGAVLYVKTNVPQSMMVPDTDNNVFGITRNPIHKEITASGSSGGLAALIKFRGALAGIGTDVGGSIRVPAYTHGVYAMKPSSGRLPYYGVKGYWEPGAETAGILCVNAPMAVSFRDCELLMKTITDAEPWLYDPSCQYLPWNEPAPLGRKLALGVIRFDTEVQTLPPVRRALEETVAKLKAAGHDLVEMELYRAGEISDNAVDIFKVDGGAFLQSQLDITGEPMTVANQNGLLYPDVKRGISDFYAYSSVRAELQRAWLLYWASSAKLTKSGKPVDALLLPIQSFPARPDGYMVRSHFSRTFNNLDYPGIVFPVTTVQMSKDDEEMPPPLNAMDARVQTTWAKGVRERLEGYPIGLQIVGQRQMEPQLFQTMHAIAAVLEGVV